MQGSSAQGQRWTYCGSVEIPATRYVRSGEIAIAYQVHGSGATDIVFSGSTASNVETVWTLPEAHRLFERLGRFARVIRFDRRDTGVSDPIQSDLTLEAHGADALAVMDAVGAERPVLLGALDGARSLAALAATQPDRFGGLIAVLASAKGGAVEAPEIADSAVRSLADLDWPEGIIDLWAPGWAEDPVRRDRLIRYVRTSATPRQAKRQLRLSLTSDVSGVLPLVQVPTLVLRPKDVAVPAEPVREFARLIPGAEYREIAGDAIGPLYALDVDELADVIEEFVTGSAPAPVTNRVLATVLFTDLVGSTQRAAELGDRAWAALLDRHHSAMRAAISEHGGEAIKTLGDGVLATFTGPAQAVRCAERIVADSRAEGLQVRTGVHTGELELAGDDVAGLAVHLGARIMGMAAPEEVLVSRTVRDLVVGSELRFTPRGEHELKGVPDRWTLYALE
jgi:class 3 adenylate cyclase